MLLYNVHVGNRIELPVQRTLCPILVKLCILVNGTHDVGLGYSIIHRFSAS